jgi:putative transposase
VVLKRDNKYLKAVFSQVLQDVALRLDKAFQAFFKGLMKHPSFRKYDRYNSFTYPQSGFQLKGRKLHLSKIGAIRIVLHRKISGVIKRVTVIRDIDQWFVAILVYESSNATVKCAEGKAGVDVGLSNVVALSDDTLVVNPRYLNTSVERIKALQRKLSRKKMGSQNREKARITLAKV